MRERTMMICRAYKKVRRLFLDTVEEDEGMSEIMSLRRQLEQSQQVIDRVLEDQCDGRRRLRAEMQKLEESRLVKEKALEDECERLKGQVGTLREELGHSHQEVHELEQENIQLEQDRVLWRREYHHLVNVIDSVEREKSAAERELRILEGVKHELEAKVDALEKEIAEESFAGSYSDSSATPTAFEAALAHANEALQNFSSALVLASGPPGEFAQSHVFARKLHWKLALRGILTDVLFANFELEGFGVEYHTKSLDVKEFRERCFEVYKVFLNGDVEELVRDARVERFVNEKARKVCEALQREDAFFDSEGKRKEEVIGKFHRAIVAVWRLHKLAFSFHPAARMLRVCGGMKLNDEYMESVLSADDIDEEEFDSDDGKVGFVVSPGFSIRKSVFKCLVYPALVRK